jgi:hypothetical protein
MQPLSMVDCRLPTCSHYVPHLSCILRQPMEIIHFFFFYRFNTTFQCFLVSLFHFITFSGQVTLFSTFVAVYSCSFSPVQAPPSGPSFSEFLLILSGFWVSPSLLGFCKSCSVSRSIINSIIPEPLL